MINIAPRYLTNIENQGQQPSFQILYQLVTLLNISLDSFFLEPEYKTIKSSKRRQIDSLLDNLNDEELVIIYNVIKAIFRKQNN